MVRQLKHHEQKLLKKVDFLNVRSSHYLCQICISPNRNYQWKQDANHREIKVIRRYHIQNRQDYSKYNKLAGQLRAFAHRLALLPPSDPFRSKMQNSLLSKLYDIGILNSTAKLSDVDNKLTVAAFCRRRLAVVMCAANMAESVSAVRFSFLLLHLSYTPSSNETHMYIHDRGRYVFISPGCQVYRTRSRPSWP